MDRRARPEAGGQHVQNLSGPNRNIQKQNLEIFRVFNQEDSGGRDEGTEERVKDETEWCGLGTWAVCNLRSLREEAGFEVVSLILSMLFKRRCPVSCWI